MSDTLQNMSDIHPYRPQILSKPKQRPEKYFSENLLNEYLDTFSEFSPENIKKFIADDPENNPSEFVATYVLIIRGLRSKNFYPHVILHILSFFTITKYAYQYEMLENGKYPICKMSNFCFSPQDIIVHLETELQKRMTNGKFKDELSYCAGKTNSFNPIKLYLIHLMKQESSEFLKKIEDFDQKWVDNSKELKKKRDDYFSMVKRIYSDPAVIEAQDYFLHWYYIYMEACENLKKGKIPPEHVCKYQDKARNIYYMACHDVNEACKRLTSQAKQMGDDINIECQDFVELSRRYNKCPFKPQVPSVSMTSLCNVVKESFSIDYGKWETYNPDHIWENWDLWMKNEYVNPLPAQAENGSDNGSDNGSHNDPLKMKEHLFIQYVLKIHRAEQLARFEKSEKLKKSS